MTNFILGIVAVGYIVGVMAMFVATIWTGDSRWAETAGVLSVPILIAALAAYVNYLRGK